MQDLIAGITELIIANSGWVALAIGLLCFGESLVLIGLMIPATSLMMATGSLLATGRFNEAAVISAAILGSILGDWVSFIIGSKLGASAYRIWPLRGHRTAVAHARIFFRRYGFLAVLLGRFLGPLRSIVPLVAGITRMPVGAFQLANIVSAAMWVPLLFAPGYLSAKHLIPKDQVNEGNLMIVGLAIGLLSALASWIASKALTARRRARKLRAIAAP